MKYCAYLFLTIIFLLSACKKETPSHNLFVPVKNILFLGHTYQWHTEGNKIDARLERLDYSDVDQIWLGGDICSETTKDYSTLVYLDSLFNLGSSTTHWSVGNHDIRNENVNWITSFTGRELFYFQADKHLSILNLNTQMREENGECDALEDQYQLIKNVCDTLQNSTHLIVLLHRVVFNDVVPDINVNEDVANVPSAHVPFLCLPNSQFHEIIYPLFAQVQERGIQVICIAGDAGKEAKSFEYQTDIGIWLLASGINNSEEQDPTANALLPPDRILNLQYDSINQNMNWDFINLDSLIAQ